MRSEWLSPTPPDIADPLATIKNEKNHILSIIDNELFKTKREF